jgi:hypothetical protein
MFTVPQLLVTSHQVAYVIAYNKPTLWLISTLLIRDLWGHCESPTVTVNSIGALCMFTCHIWYHEFKWVHSWAQKLTVLSEVFVVFLVLPGKFWNGHLKCTTTTSTSIPVLMYTYIPNIKFHHIVLQKWKINKKASVILGICIKKAYFIFRLVCVCAHACAPYQSLKVTGHYQAYIL